MCSWITIWSQDTLGEEVSKSLGTGRGYCYIGIYDHDVSHSGDTTGIESKVKAVFVKAVEKGVPGA